MNDCQCNTFIYGMRFIFFRFDVECIDVGKCRMIAGIIKEIGMISNTMLCYERIG